MVTVTSKINRPNALVLRRGGKVYSIKKGQKTKIPLGIAIGFMPDSGLEVEFEESDREAIVDLITPLKNSLKRNLGIPENTSDEDLKNHVFPVKEKKLGRKKPKKKTPKKEPVVEEVVENVTEDIVEDKEDNTKEKEVKVEAPKKKRGRPKKNVDKTD
mgnify:FL=1